MTDAERFLEETSRTFALPIRRLPEGLREAVASAYLSMRAIDEIEDHRSMPAHRRARLLTDVSLAYQAAIGTERTPDFAAAFREAEDLPEVTLRLPDWAALAPAMIRPRVWAATAAMAERMAWWCDSGFDVRDEQDLDRYTFAVAGAVGLLLCDLWAWFAGVATDRGDAVAFGRGLQAVNILRNRREDLAAGVDFFPAGWSMREMTVYARRHLVGAERYAAALPRGPIREFCAIPLALAHATLEALEAGREKLTRAEVAAVVERACPP